MASMMWPREAPTSLRPGPTRPKTLVASTTSLRAMFEVLEGLAEGLFAFAFGVDVGGIEEIDAGIDGGLYQLVGSRLVDAGRWLSRSRRR